MSDICDPRGDGASPLYPATSQSGPNFPAMAIQLKDLFMLQLKVRTSGLIFEPGSSAKLVGEVTKEAIKYGRSLIKSRTPVRTGNLRDGWQTDLSFPNGSIFSDVEYGIFVERGTRYFVGRRMMERSLPDIDRYAERELRQKVRRLQ